MGLFGLFKKDKEDVMAVSLPQTASEIWCRDSYAVWSYLNCDGWEFIGGCKQDKEAKEDLRYILERDWGVVNKQGCLKTVESLTQVLAVPQVDKATAAWDLCRATQVLGMGHVAAYLSREELNSLSVDIGKKMQTTFTDWDDLLACYQAGFAQWADETYGESATEKIEERKAAIATLSALPGGPYRQPWALPLQA